VFVQEGEQQALAFAKRHADAVRLTAPGQCLPVASQDSQTGQDGFFYAKFLRQPNQS
jgi:16S rRNA (cytosine967-C5)-methyltransferase